MSSTLDTETHTGTTPLLAAVDELVPLLRANAAEAERTRRIPQQSIRALADAGAFRMTTPRRYGGSETDIVELTRVLDAIGRGCGSTSWVTSLHAVGSYFVGRYDDRAQDEVWADGPDSRVASVFSPGGLLTPVDGGYLLSGRWPFNTGCRSATWDAVAARVDGPADGPPEILLALVPMSELTIADDWHPSGLAGTGSNTTVAESVFVPEHRLLPVAEALAGGTRSVANADADLYHCALFPFVLVSSTGTPLGMARAAMDHFRERAPGRMITYTGWAVAEAQTTHVTVADAAVNIRAAELLARDLTERLRAAAIARRDPGVAERAAIRAESAHVVRLSRLAVEALNSISGASSIQGDVPIQRVFRDIEALSLHAALNLNTNLEVHGRVLMGQDPATPFL
ncbi:MULTISPECIES: acyl-CoA dehydrogenase family protein [Pseudonocardia]|uniref:Flavin-dependent monooxygenase, oxygenase subunit HsaA n=2 Tax=Pseudonocardia TaxID=1847 RepID=A0A1Y2MKH6_PSEAH|nr:MULTISPECIES: acyl-CoA dehydrogenase family protein [Pseudonocardia]OSY35157.1 Flavin-dependent monooxygenase, oxygenase subunit HsaA [Pseudonocardia autotrophica]TDN74968.1 alkylation response protein AidB-like acyl-CoA dehydrogenase [Pseudonocardia autotrophica]BBF98906.1 acyl-CoA dehydrogenase [Pseudonocardia autotrophica]GEC28628.1 acyl-CoA dehydrogenase [Pseudonocardia saturnea]